MNRAQQAIGKLFFCLRITKGWNSFARLVMNSKRFSGYYKIKERSNSVPNAIQSDKEEPTVYQLNLHDKAKPDTISNSRATFLRTYAGDIQMFYDMMLDKSYEVAALKQSKNLVIVDAGANIGMAALYFLHHYDVSKIYCIEPDAKNLEILKLNLRPEIKDGKVVVSANALSSFSGTMAWNDSGWAYNARLSTVHPAETNDASFVNTITIEDLLRAHEISLIDLLKIDVEGAEEEIFRGELSWLEKVQRLIIEIHTEPAKQLIKGKLIQAGFDFHSCSNSPYSDIYLAEKKPA